MFDVTCCVLLSHFNNVYFLIIYLLSNVVAAADAAAADDVGFIYLNQSEVDEGVTLAQLGRVVKTYVSEVYESSGQDLYNVLMYQYKHGHHDLRADRDRPAVRDLMMRLLADGHQVQQLFTHVFTRKQT